MNIQQLHDRYSRGMGVAARSIGEDYDLFRPNGSMEPLTADNRVMRVPVYIDVGTAGYRQLRGFEFAMRATFDAVATCVGDYLRGPRGVLFICALPLLKQPLCILTNASVDVLRPSGASSVGLSSYGGVIEPQLDMILGDWPVQMISSGGGRAGVLPVDGGQSGWSVVMPLTPVEIAPSDLLQDAMGRRYVVKSVATSEMGQVVSVKGTEA